MIRFLLFMATVLFTTHVWAQPSNNECSTATLLTANSTCTYTSGTLHNATVSSSMTNCTGAGTDPNVFYTFVATDASMTVTVDNVHSSLDVVVQVMSCLLYTSPSPRDRTRSRMPSSA